LKFADSTIREKALYVASIYYLIIATIIFIPTFYFLLVHFFSSEPEVDYNLYAFQVVWLSFLFMVILINYQIIFRERKRYYLAINIFFSAIQIISFHFSHFLYLLSFGLNIGILFGYAEGPAFQIIFNTFNTTGSIKIVDSAENPFISFNLIPVVILWIMIANYKGIKKTETNLPPRCADL